LNEILSLLGVFLSVFEERVDDILKGLLSRGVLVEDLQLRRQLRELEIVVLHFELPKHKER